MAFFKYQNVVEIFQHDPSRYLPITEFIQTVMRGESSFTAGERELIAAYVSGLNACDYCYGSHQAIATDLNVDPKLLEAILTDLAEAPIEEGLYPVFALVRKLTLNPSKVTQADVDAILQAGWDEQAIEDVIGVCALFNFMNRFVNAYGLEMPDNEQLTAMAKGINTQGYKKLLQIAIQAQNSSV
ncbi:MAG: peroxidase-related enzyme [Prochloraceae cyanobacterium]|nr:peroxidase-related enzyme [Prochloraceae cyanobacterium]